jgi:hypothetical protein
VKLTNTDAVKDILSMARLSGYHGSFTLFRRDASGKEVPTRVIAEALESPPEPNDTSSSVKLLPYHFIGTDYKGSIAELNMIRPGNYYMWVEYHCRISGADVKVSFFGNREWSTQIERGMDRSSLVDPGQELFGGMLASTGPEKAFHGCIVELAMLDAAEVGGVAERRRC